MTTLALSLPKLRAKCAPTPPPPPVISTTCPETSCNIGKSAHEILIKVFQSRLCLIYGDCHNEAYSAMIKYPLIIRINTNCSYASAGTRAYELLADKMPIIAISILMKPSQCLETLYSVWYFICTIKFNNVIPNNAESEPSPHTAPNIHWRSWYVCVCVPTFSQLNWIA